MVYWAAGVFFVLGVIAAVFGFLGALIPVRLR